MAPDVSGKNGEDVYEPDDSEEPLVDVEAEPETPSEPPVVVPAPPPLVPDSVREEIELDTSMEAEDIAQKDGDRVAKTTQMVKLVQDYWDSFGADLNVNEWTSPDPFIPSKTIDFLPWIDMQWQEVSVGSKAFRRIAIGALRVLNDVVAKMRRIAKEWENFQGLLTTLLEFLAAEITSMAQINEGLKKALSQEKVDKEARIRALELEIAAQKIAKEKERVEIQELEQKHEMAEQVKEIEHETQLILAKTWTDFPDGELNQDKWDSVKGDVVGLLEKCLTGKSRSNNYLYMSYVRHLDIYWHAVIWCQEIVKYQVPMVEKYNQKQYDSLLKLSIEKATQLL